MIVSFPSDYAEKDMRDVSIYQYRRGYNLQYLDETVPHDKKGILSQTIEYVSTGKYNLIDIEIIKALYRFKYLNIYNLSKYLNKTNKLVSGMKKQDYTSNLEHLRAEGVVVAYARDIIVGEEDARLIIYTLSEGAYDYVTAYCNVRKTYRKEKDYYAVSTTRALEILSLNQWYIAMLTSKNYRSKYYRCKFKKEHEYTQIEAAFMLNVDKEHYGNKNMMVYAFALPKKEDGQSDFINHLLSINSYLQSPQSKLPLSVIIITCESIRRMKEAYASVRAFRELDDIEMMFVLDEDMINGSGIDRLYMCDYNSKTKGVTYIQTQIYTF